MNILTNILNIVIPAAYADTAAAPAAAPQTAGGMSMMLMLTVFIVFMYFVMWRPQSKRAKEHRNLLSGLAKGDEVITAGGILGRIAKVTDNYILLSLADNVEIAVQKSSVVSALPKGTIKSI